MKKKFRDLTIDEVHYGWTVEADDDRDICERNDYITLRIWKCDKIIYNEQIKNQAVTPATVRAIIDQIK